MQWRFSMQDRGYTLIEMVLVVVIIGILASIAIQSLGRDENTRRFDETVQEMERLSRAIVGDDRLITDGIRTDFGYVGDVGSLPSNLDDLVLNPGGYSTWKGPYITNDFNENGADYKTDAWNNPYAYSGGITIGSSADGTPITKQFAGTAADLIANSVKGIVRDKAGLPPSDSASNVNVTLFFPDGSGSMTSLSEMPSRSGEFSFDNLVPIGIHLIRAIDASSNDTAAKYIAVNPGSVTLTELRIPSEIWGSSGGGGGTGNIEYVGGSAMAYGPQNRNIRFDITNTGSGPVTANSLVLIFNVVPDAYYQKINWNGNPVYNNTRLASGDNAVLASPVTINPSETLTVEYESFWDRPGSGGSFVNMSGVDFQLIFPDGNSVLFTTP